MVLHCTMAWGLWCYTARWHGDYGATLYDGMGTIVVHCTMAWGLWWYTARCQGDYGGTLHDAKRTMVVHCLYAFLYACLYACEYRHSVLGRCTTRCERLPSSHSSRSSSFFFLPSFVFKKSHCGSCVHMLRHMSPHACVHMAARLSARMSVHVLTRMSPGMSIHIYAHMSVLISVHMCTRCIRPRWHSSLPSSLLSLAIFVFTFHTCTHTGACAHRLMCTDEHVHTNVRYTCLYGMSMQLDCARIYTRVAHMPGTHVWHVCGRIIGRHRCVRCIA